MRSFSEKKRETKHRRATSAGSDLGGGASGGAVAAGGSGGGRAAEAVGHRFRAAVPESYLLARTTHDGNEGSNLISPTYLPSDKFPNCFTDFERILEILTSWENLVNFKFRIVLFF